MLGICLGYQAMGEFFGAQVTRAPVPVHGKVGPVYHGGHKMFLNVPNPFQATRYHSLILEGCEKTDFEITAVTHGGIAMAAAHNHYPLWGMQFHPEAWLTECGLQLICNWAALINEN